MTGIHQKDTNAPGFGLDGTETVEVDPSGDAEQVHISRGGILKLFEKVTLEDVRGRPGGKASNINKAGEKILRVVVLVGVFDRGNHPHMSLISFCKKEALRPVSRCWQGVALRSSRENGRRARC